MGNLFGALFMGIAALMFIFPEKFARMRLKGAKDSTPSAGLVRFIRYVVAIFLFLLNLHIYLTY
ncbi:uncharacterized protein HVO_A0348A (plasmid) [Haloferax volcanii DS2]|nr:uncharacterized protein HVO_A0348A [Haloferax volcanii DS2]